MKPRVRAQERAGGKGYKLTITADPEEAVRRLPSHQPRLTN